MNWFASDLSGCLFNDFCNMGNFNFYRSLWLEAQHSAVVLVVTVIRLCDEYGSWSCCLDYAAAIFSFLCSNRVASDFVLAERCCWVQCCVHFECTECCNNNNNNKVIIIFKIIKFINCHIAFRQMQRRWHRTLLSNEFFFPEKVRHRPVCLWTAMCLCIVLRHDGVVSNWWRDAIH